MATGTIRPAPEYFVKTFTLTNGQTLAPGGQAYLGAIGIPGYTCISVYLMGAPASGYFILISNPSYSAENNNWVSRIYNIGSNTYDMTGWSAKFVFVHDLYLHPVDQSAT